MEPGYDSQPFLNIEFDYLQAHGLDGCSHEVSVNELCKLDTTSLNHPWPDQHLLDEIRCSLAILLSNYVRDRTTYTLPPLTFELFNDTDFPKTTAIDTDNRVFKVRLHGVPMLLKLEELSRIDTDNPIHELFIGYQLNKYKSTIPFIAYVFGGFSCSIPLGGATPCSTIQPSGNYVLYEFINGRTLTDMFSLMERTEAWTVIRMIRATLAELYKLIGFIHQDLHFDNIIIRRLDTYYRFVIGDETFISQYLPSIIDLTRSQIRYNGRIHSPVNRSLMLPGTFEYDWSSLLYSWCSLTKDLPELIPTNGGTDSYLIVYRKLTHEDYIKVFTMLDAKYPTSVVQDVPLFKQNVLNEITYDKSLESCPKLKFMPTEAELERAADELLTKDDNVDLNNIN